MTKNFSNTQHLRIFPDICFLAIIALSCWTGLYFWRLSTTIKIKTTFDFQPQTSKPMSQEQIERISTGIPRVNELNCAAFLIPPHLWNKTENHLAEVIPKAELEKTSTTYEDCHAIHSSWVDIPVSKFEQTNPIAFSIMIYNNFDRLARLLRAIYRSSNVYCLHIDDKSTTKFKRSVSQIASCLTNVFITKHSIPVWWSDTSVLEQEMICLKELWKHKVKWRWVINLTGEEFPLKTNLELVHILSTQHDFNDVFVDPCTEGGPNPEGLDYCRLSTRAQFRERWEMAPLPPLYVQPYKGQVHVVLSRGMVDYILHSEDAKAIYNWSLTTLFSDEIFFSTLNSNAHLRAPGSNAVFLEHPLRRKPTFARLKLWRVGLDPWLHCSVYLRHICLLSPREILLMTTSLQLFANKFKPYHQPVGYACMEEWYFNKVVRELQTGRVQLDLRVYHNLYNMHLGI